MTPRKRTPTKAVDHREPRLTVSEEVAQSAIQERIELGKALLDKPLATVEELKDRRRDYQIWYEYNNEWLLRRIGPSIAAEYSARPSIGVWGGERSLVDKANDLRSDIERDVRRLESITGRLHFWMDEAEISPSTASTETSGAVFIVHGRNMARAQEVARMIERSTGRDAVILREQPNQGRTVLEKFESFASDAAFAVVLLTADDEGRMRGEAGDPRPRGRQNVIFELGFFYGKLGRDRVAVLVDEGVEHPSDVAGLVYTLLDESGAWKQELARELSATGIAVRVERIP